MNYNKKHGEIDNYKNKDKMIFNKHCKGHVYFPSIIKKKINRIVAIGDLHGDYNLMIKTLKLAKVINNNNKWIGGDTYVVQVGDQLDNFRPFNNNYGNTNIMSGSNVFEKAEDIRVLEFMTHLNVKAQKKGGAVVSLLGNHEILNVNGDMRYVSKEDINMFKNYVDPHTKQMFDNSVEARRHAFTKGNEYAKLLACSRLPAIIINDYLFVHAGFVNKLIDELKITGGDDLYKISYSIRRWLLNLINEDNVAEIITSKNYSPFWDRILGSIPPNVSNDHPECVNHLNKSLKLFNVNSMVIGHTPQPFAKGYNANINKTCGNGLWRVDVGSSFAFNQFDQLIKDKDIINMRKAQVLLIEKDKEPVILQ